MPDFKAPEALTPAQRQQQAARQEQVARSRQIDSFCRTHRVPEKLRGFLQNFYAPK